MNGGQDMNSTLLDVNENRKVSNKKNVAKIIIGILLLVLTGLVLYGISLDLLLMQ
mgnify:CR=1 FL=1